MYHVRATCSFRFQSRFLLKATITCPMLALQKPMIIFFLKFHIRHQSVIFFCCYTNLASFTPVFTKGYEPLITGFSLVSVALDFSRTTTSNVLIRNINNKLLIDKELVMTIHCTQTIKDYTASHLLRLTTCRGVHLDILWVFSLYGLCLQIFNSTQHKSLHKHTQVYPAVEILTAWMLVEG